MAIVKTRRFKTGDTAKYIGFQPGKASSSNSMAHGTVLTITGNYATGSKYPAYYVMDVTGMNRGFVYEHELNCGARTIPEIKDEIKSLKKKLVDTQDEIKEYENKIEIMNDLGVDEYDDDTFKAYMVLKELGIKDFKKAQNIVKILSK